MNAKKFYAITGFKPSYDLDNGLEQTIAYYKEIMKAKNLVSQMKDVNWTK